MCRSGHAALPALGGALKACGDRRADDTLTGVKNLTRGHIAALAREVSHVPRDDAWWNKNAAVGEARAPSRRMPQRLRADHASSEAPRSTVSRFNRTCHSRISPSPPGFTRHDRGLVHSTAHSQACVLETLRDLGRRDPQLPRVRPPDVRLPPDEHQASPLLTGHSIPH